MKSTQTDTTAHSFLHFEVDADSKGTRLDRYLTAQHPAFSRSAWQRLLREGSVSVNGAIGASKTKLRGGEAIVAKIPPPAPSELIPVEMPLDVLFEDEHLLVLNKAPGLVVHPAPSVKVPTLVHGLLFRNKDFKGIGGEERPGIVHRLDKGTSGVMVVAKTEIAHRELVALFKVRDIERRYIALLSGTPRDAAGMWRSEIGRNPRNRLKMASVPKGGRKAATHYRVLQSLPKASLLELKLETGRTHQIRVHASEAGHPVLGDSTYGGVIWTNLSQDPDLQAVLKAVDHQLLHAKELGFVHPVTKERLHFEVPPPPEFQAVLDRLKELADE